jgi:hypothetical protein
VLGEKYPNSEDQRERFYDPKDRIKSLFVARLDFVIGDIAQKFPHGFLRPQTKALGFRWILPDTGHVVQLIITFLKV